MKWSPAEPIMAQWEQQEADSPLLNNASAEAAECRGCGPSVTAMLAAAPEESIEIVLAFASRCHDRGWWPRESWVLKKVRAATGSDRKPQNLPHLASADLAAGILAFLQGRHKEARRDLRRAVAYLQKLGDMKRLCRALYFLGRVDLFQDRYDEALEQYEEALKVARKARSDDVSGMILRDVAHTYFVLGKNRLALPRAKQALELLGPTKTAEAELAQCYMVYGHICFALDDFPRAKKHYESYQRLANSSHDSGEQLIAKSCLCDVLLYGEEDLKSAHQGYEEVLRASHETGYTEGVQDCNRNLGDIAAMAGRLPEAREYYKVALEKSVELVDTRKEQIVLGLVANLDVLQGRFRAARSLYTKQARHFERVDDEGWLAESSLALAGLERALGNLSDAGRLAGKALKLAQHDEAGAQEKQHRALCLLGQGEIDRGRTESALKLVKEAQVIADAVGKPSMGFRCAKLTALARAESGIPGGASGAATALETVLQGETRLGLVVDLAGTKRLLAHVLWLDQRHAEAARNAEESGILFDRIGSAYESADALSLAVTAQASAGRANEAQLLALKKHLAVLRKAGAMLLAARAECRLGLCLQQLGSAKLAGVHLSDGLKWLRSSGVDDQLVGKARKALRC